MQMDLIYWQKQKSAESEDRHETRIYIEIVVWSMEGSARFV